MSKFRVKIRHSTIGVFTPNKCEYYLMHDNTEIVKTMTKNCILPETEGMIFPDFEDAFNGILNCKTRLLQYNWFQEVICQIHDKFLSMKKDPEWGFNGIATFHKAEQNGKHKQLIILNANNDKFDDKHGDKNGDDQNPNRQLSEKKVKISIEDEFNNIKLDDVCNSVQDHMNNKIRKDIEFSNMVIGAIQNRDAQTVFDLRNNDHKDIFKFICSYYSKYNVGMYYTDPNYVRLLFTK